MILKALCAKLSVLPGACRSQWNNKMWRLVARLFFYVFFSLQIIKAKRPVLLHSCVIQCCYTVQNTMTEHKYSALLHPGVNNKKLAKFKSYGFKLSQRALQGDPLVQFFP